MQPLSLTDETPLCTNDDHGEGEGLDEGKVQVDEMHFDMLPATAKGSKPVPDSDHEDDDKRILESHVEVKIDFESSSISGGEPSSPLFPSSATRAYSYSSSIEASPPASSYRTKRYGFALPPGVTYDLDVDTVDDDSDDYPEICDWTSSALFRGRSITRKKLTSFEIYGVSPNGTDVSARGKGLSRLKSLRSMSSNLRSISNPKIPSKGVETEETPAGRPKTLLRGLRSRKSSPLLTSSVESSRTVVAQCSGPYDSLEPKPTKKSGLKSWAKFMIPERKRNKHVPLSQLRNQARSRAPSPTGSWARTQEYEHEEVPILPSESRPISRDSCRTNIIGEDKETGPTLEADLPTLPNLPDLLGPAADIPTAHHQHESVENETHQDDYDETTVADITMPQNRATFATEDIYGPPPQHIEERQELAENVAENEISTAEDDINVVGNEINIAENKIDIPENENETNIAENETNTAEDENNKAEEQRLVEADFSQKEETYKEPILDMSASETDGFQQEPPVEREDSSSEQAAEPEDALLEKQVKSITSPRSTFLQSIIDSSNVAPHPPRKSSLRQILSSNRNPPAIPKFSFPLPRGGANKVAQADAERSLLSETDRENEFRF